MNAEQRAALREAIDRRRRELVETKNPRAPRRRHDASALEVAQRPLTTREEKRLVARDLRAAGWSSTEIGRRLGVSDSTVRNWCLGRTCACGAPLDGSNGRKHELCPKCAARKSGAEAMIWTPEVVIARIREWADLYGAPPACPDWGAFLARSRLHDEVRARRFEEANGYWPHFKSVVERFGTWNAAIEAAGFEPRAAHGGAGNELRRRRAAA